MSKSKRSPRSADPLVTLGHRVDPAVKVMLDELAHQRLESQRLVIEQAIRSLHRHTFANRGRS